MTTVGDGGGGVRATSDWIPVTPLRSLEANGGMVQSGGGSRRTTCTSHT